MDELTFNYCLSHIRERKYFDKLYNFFYRRIVIHLDRKFHTPSISEDVAQECFIRLFELKEHKYIKYYTSWIYAICDNIALRKLGKEHAEYLKCERENAYTEIDERETEAFGIFQKSIDKLDPCSRSIFYLHYVEAYSLKEIADILGISYANVRQKHHRGEKFIKKDMK